MSVAGRPTELDRYAGRLKRIIAALCDARLDATLDGVREALLLAQASAEEAFGHCLTAGAKPDAKVYRGEREDF